MFDYLELVSFLIPLKLFSVSLLYLDDMLKRFYVRPSSV